MFVGVLSPLDLAKQSTELADKVILIIFLSMSCQNKEVARDPENKT